jgi:hypothetical protein
VESQLQDADVTDDKPADFLRDPYPYFAQKRAGAGIFHGTVIDYSKTPESLRPKNSFAAVSFDAVNKAFRDGRVFNSAIYDSTIGLFIGPTILAMEGKKHRDHRNLVSAAFKSKAPGPLGAHDRAADLQYAHRRVHRRRRSRSDPDLHLRISYPSHRQAPRSTGRRPKDVSQARRAVDQLRRQLRTRL